MGYSTTTDYGTFTLHRRTHKLESGDHHVYEFLRSDSETDMEPCELPEGYRVILRYEDAPPILVKD